MIRGVMSARLLPPALPYGGTIAVVAPSSPVDEERLTAGVAALERHGFRVRLGAHVGDRYGHHAGSDRDRAADLNAAFADPEVDAIFCARGGSGSIRVLPHLDYERVARHPKPFVGYSDVTSVQLALLKRAGLPSVFGPMVTPNWSRELSPVCRDALWRLICRPAPAGMLRDRDDPRPFRTLRGGVARAPLAGGTLALVASSLATPYQIELAGRLFFFEDVHESPARIERYLTQLLQAGLLDGVAGFVIGTAPYDETDHDRFLTLEQIYRDLLLPLDKPLVYGLSIGHEPSPIPIPLGITAVLDADGGLLRVVEPMVRG
jgi:muramoyltetrapeptide carboxypeptidase